MINAFRKLLRLERPPELPTANILDFPGPKLQPVPDPEPEENADSIFADVLTADLAEIEKLEQVSSGESDQTDQPHSEATNNPEWSNEMSQHNDCHDHRKKYVSFNPPARAQVGTYYEFDSYCCDDDIAQAAQDFYDFAIMKKGTNPAISRVELVISPNGAARFVVIHWRFLLLVALILADAEELWEKYLDLLGY